MTITIRTEAAFTDGGHDVFFNRGVASSQAYRRRFGTAPIGQLDAAAALEWLSRDLGTALLRFIAATEAGDRLLCCFYEFRYQPAARALRDALDRGVDVHIVVDAKTNGRTTADGTVLANFPRDDNLAMLAAVGIPQSNWIPRQARPNDIAHNKFMVRIPEGRDPAEVWTGSTNLSQGGIAGQTNVGHWLRDPAIAKR